MKHLKTYKNIKNIKYKVGDIVGYDRYLKHTSIPVEILAVTPTSKYVYFVQEIKPPHHTHILEIDDVIDLSPEQKFDIELYLNTQKYNI